jgi:transposase
LDVHKATSAVASVSEEREAEVVFLGTIGTRQGDLDKGIRKLQSKGKPLPLGYAAGPCGDWLSRYLTKKDLKWWVVAPAQIPQQAGDRVKTERRAAVQLARRLRSGDLTPGYVPAVEDEASRALGRARAAVRQEGNAAKVRRQACLLRPARRDEGRATWGPAPLRWLAQVGCPTPAQQLVCPEYVRAVSEPTERLQRLEAALQTRGQTWRGLPVGEALPALRGIQFTAAVLLSAALGDLSRCDHPRQLLSSLGLLPSEPPRGSTAARGASPSPGPRPPAGR